MHDATIASCTCEVIILSHMVSARLRFLLITSSMLLIAGCSLLPASRPTASPSATDTRSPPTATSIPHAAVVDGEIIPLAAFDNEVMRYEQAQQSAGIDLATLGDYKSIVLEELIDLKLLAQGARKQGLDVSEAEIDQRTDALRTELGGPENMDAWFSDYFYTYESFRSALLEELLAMNMVNWISENVPAEVEQVHARHILTATSEEAETLRSQLLAGADFETLARAYSLDPSTRPAGGDLGWFPPGILLQPAVEEAAFATQAGELSPVIESELGFHVIEVLERGNRPLSFQDRLAFQERAVQDWLDVARSSAVIERNIAH
jgi:parvulin-like peptidyl-prolyl isomerase